MPAIDVAPSEQYRLDRLSRWFFWILWAVIALVAAAFYYEKAAEDRSAFVRWRPQVLQFWTGQNIYEDMLFPNPPIMPITLYPLMVLPTVAGAMCWFAIKVAITTLSLMMCLSIVQPPGRFLPPMFRSLILLLTLRPILGDLHHGNNNLLILFLVVSMFYAWRRGHDVGAGLLMALAASYKVTPALFFLYFAYKRSWRTVGWGLVGLVLFLVVVPSAIIGPAFNWECLQSWFHHMVTPFVMKGATSAQEINQSIVGVLTRLLTEITPGRGRYQVHLDLNLLSLPPWLVSYLVKAVAFGLLAILAILCRTPIKDRRDSRILGEVALVVLTMLFVSERSWKHHFVTLLIPYSYLVAEFFSSRVNPRSRTIIAAAWAASFILMAAASADIGGWFAEGQGHEIAQGYGSFLWAGVVLYATVAWRVWGAGRKHPRSRPRRWAFPRFPGHIFRSLLSGSARLENIFGLFSGVGHPFVTIIEMKWIPATRTVAERGAVPIRSIVDRPIPHFNPVAGQGGPMNPSKSTRRTHRAWRAAPEVLEDRVVLSAGQGSTFAITPGTVPVGGKATSVSFEISPTLFTAPKGGKLLIGIDVSPASSSSTTTSTLEPEIVSITSASGQVTQVQHGTYNAKVAKANKIHMTTTSASLVDVTVPKAGQPANDYTVQVKGLNKTSGQFLLGFYLPGDATGEGTVTQADLKTIRQSNGMTAQNANYNFNADANRDGIINGQDLADAKKDLGASTQVSPVVSVNLDPASDPAANRTSPYSTVHFAGTMTPNGTITFVDNSGGGVSTATADSTGAYSIIVPLVLGSNTFQVTTSDGFGQSITGAISPVVYSPPTTS